MLRGSFNKATSRFSASLLSAVRFWVPQMLSYGSAGVPAVPATISMSGLMEKNASESGYFGAGCIHCVLVVQGLWISPA